MVNNDGRVDRKVGGKSVVEPWKSVMTTRDYDSDANFFTYYFPITTPSAPACTITRLCSLFVLTLFSFCPVPCTLTTASPPQPGP